MEFDARMVLDLYGDEETAVKAIMRWRGLSREDAEKSVKKAAKRG